MMCLFSRFLTAGCAELVDLDLSGTFTPNCIKNITDIGLEHVAGDS
jgi:hypothetical protein